MTSLPQVTNANPLIQDQNALLEHEVSQYTVAESRDVLIQKLASAPNGTFAIVRSFGALGHTAIVLRDRAHILKIQDGAFRVSVPIAIHSFDSVLKDRFANINIYIFQTFQEIQQFYGLRTPYRLWEEQQKPVPKSSGVEFKQEASAVNLKSRLKGEIESPQSGWVKRVHIHNMGPISQYLIDNPDSFSISPTFEKSRAYYLSYSKGKEIVYATFDISEKGIRVSGNDQIYPTLNDFLTAYGKDLRNALPVHQFRQN